jgi:hypothetical protein
MIVDKYTKAILTLIAISLFVISLNPWVAPTKAYAELSGHNLQGIEQGLKEITKAIKQKKSLF